MGKLVPPFRGLCVYPRVRSGAQGAPPNSHASLVASKRLNTGQMNREDENFWKGSFGKPFPPGRKAPGETGEGRQRGSSLTARDVGAAPFPRGPEPEGPGAAGGERSPHPGWAPARPLRAGQALPARRRRRVRSGAARRGRPGAAPPRSGPAWPAADGR